jgi:hypothetical protein
MCTGHVLVSVGDVSQPGGARKRTFLKRRSGEDSQVILSGRVFLEKVLPVDVQFDFAACRCFL